MMNIILWDNESGHGSVFLPRYSPALKKWGLYWICLVLPSFCHSVILSFCNLSDENFCHTFLRNCEA